MESVTGAPGPQTWCTCGRDWPPISPNIRAPGNGRLRRRKWAVVTLCGRSRRCQRAGGRTPSRADGGKEKGARWRHRRPPCARRGSGSPVAERRGPWPPQGSRPPPGRIVAPAPAGGAGPSPTKPPRGRPQDTRPQPGTGPARKGGARQRERARSGSPRRPQVPSLSAHANRSHRPL